MPVVGVGIALAFNRTGLNVPAAGLKLSRITYCGILNGNITNWNDVRFRLDNGGAIIAANIPIKVVRRSDGSGTTFALSSHLNAACKIPGTAGVPAGGGTPGLPASAVWNRGVGTNSLPVPNTPPKFPQTTYPPQTYPNPPYTPACTLPAPADTVCCPSTFIGASGDGGVADAILSTPGAIGYADNATRFTRSLPAAVLQNKSGNFIPVSPTTIANAFTRVADTDPNPRRIRIDILDPTPTPVPAFSPALTPSETLKIRQAYPIVATSYLLFYDKYAYVEIANGIKGFINWALGVPPVPAPGGDVTVDPNAIAIARQYAPLPDDIKTLSRNVVNTYVDGVFQP